MAQAWERWVVGGECHVPYHDQKLLDLWFSFLGDFKPDRLVIIGDGFDCYQLSRFDKDPKRKNDLQRDIDIWVSILKEMASLAPTKDYIEGNHEFRFRKYLISKAEELSSLECLDVENLFHLKELGFQYHRSSSPDKFVHNWIECGKDLWIGHFDKVNKYSAFTAKNLVEEYHISIITGHTHRGGMYLSRDSKGFLEGIENFCMCSLKPNYVKYPNWQHGWTVVYKKINDSRFQIVPINVTNYAFFFGEKEYRL